MKLGGLSWSWLGGITAAVILALGVSFWLFACELERLRDEELTGQLLSEARLVVHALRDDWAARDARPIAGMVRALHDEGTDVAVLVTDGTVLVDTTGRGAAAESLLQQPEVKAALREGCGVSTRSGVHGVAPSRAVAVRVGSDAGELGVVWLARPRWTFVSHARSFGRVIGLVGLIAVATVLGLGIALTRRWAGLLRRLARAAQGLAEGDLSARTEIAGADEFARLAQSLNEMRRRLLGHVEAIDRQRRMLEALLDQLEEGVIATDDQRRIVMINPAALRLLNLGPPDGDRDRFLGKAVEECLPQHELQRLLSAAPDAPALQAGQAAGTGPAEAASPTVAERHLRIEGSRGVVHLLARASDLRPPGPADQAPGASIGRLMVLTDVSSLRRALDMQTDFVANASHELRTPLSSIRAAVETLLQMDLSRDGAEAGRFIEVIDRHSARLAAMAADLLDLSRIQGAGAARQKAALSLDEELGELTERFAEAVRAKGLHWEVDWSPGERRTLVVSRHLLRLVLDNLVDNAIQFTEPGGHVRVVCRTEPGQVVFEVADDGCGIPEADQQRVFERFYQVDRARGGTRRGTGLGLAIVRDAVTAMGGSVKLQSRVGAGTRVTVTIAQPEAPA